MATMFPKSFPADADENRWAERQVFEALQKLDDDWTILYSVAWQGIREGRQGDGEADYILLHPSHGLFCAEVKGGSTIEVSGRSWFSINKDGRHKIKDPFKQASDSKYVLREWLGSQIPEITKQMRFGHFVIFPSHIQQNDMGPEAPRSIIWDKNDLRDPVESLQRVCNHWQLVGMSRPLANQIKSKLAPQFRLLHSDTDPVDSALDQQRQLTDQQWAGFQLLRRQKRALITGAAGTGKTVLAHERALQSANSGLRTLLTCYNRPLAQRLRSLSIGVDNLTVETFHALCQRFASSSQLDQTIEQSDHESFLDDQLPEVLPDAAQILGESFDTIIVDEGQDFLPHWWTALELLLRDDDSSFIIFADSNQAIYSEHWQSPVQAEPFQLDTNCRNTREIAERVYRTGLGVEAALDTSGPPPSSRSANNRRKAVDRAIEFVKQMRETHLQEPNRIVVLTTSTDMCEELDHADWGVDVAEEHGQDGLFIETVHRFKGLESDGVVLVIDPEHELDDTALLRLAYVGMSRSRALLGVVAPSKALELIKWSSE